MNGSSVSVRVMASAPTGFVHRGLKYGLHATEHGVAGEPRPRLRGGGRAQARALSRIVAQQADRRGKGLGVPRPHHQGRHALPRRLADRADSGGHHGEPAGHGLHDRLRHTLIRVGRQREDIETLQPRDDVVVMPGHDYARRKPVLRGFAAYVLLHRPVTDYDGLHARIRYSRQRIEQVEVPFPAAQRGDDADQKRLRGKAKAHARGGAIARAEAPQVDPGRNRRHPRGVGSGSLDHLSPQDFPCGDHVVRPAAVQPASEKVIRDRRRDVARAYHCRRAFQADACQGDQPAIRGAVCVDEIQGFCLQQDSQGAPAREILSCDRQGAHRESALLRLGVETRLGRCGDQQIVPTPCQSFGLLENPDFLPAPSA